ncbi:MAG: starch-binding protein [Lachnospiraceae bacterium]|nr:starch-binding protein [Lachnospiraceae bacterium]
MEKKKAIGCLVSLTMLMTSCFGTFDGNTKTITGMAGEQVYAATNNYGLADNIQDGVILHCFDWKYNDIKAELPNIAKAGFTSIQTSPAQTGVNSGIWYWLYQPLGFSVSSNDLGTRSELQSLCTEADKYGIKIVVDVVANHLAGNHTNIQSDLKDSKYWHTYGQIDNYSNRTAVTTGDLGMQDLKSEDSYVQQLVRNYLMDLKSLGVDGIRWDAAKHIALPSEGCAFWSTVCNDSGLYHYGEMLGEPGASSTSKNNELASEYATYMSFTDSSYGQTLRNAFNSGTAPTSYGNWTNRGIQPKKLVYWGESHDTWSNGKDSGYSNEMSQNVIDRAYAMAASRQSATALYFSRPSSAVKEQIMAGAKGSTHFKSAEVAAVNHFHNAMIGQSEYFVSSNNVAAVCRKKGVVIAMGSGNGGQVNIPNGGSLVEPGTYTDEITGNTFTITSSTITGTVGSTGIAVVYDWKSQTETPTTTYTAYLDLPSGWGTPVYCYAYDKEDGETNAGWPGVQMTYDSATALYKYTVPANITDPRVIFFYNNDNRYPGDGEEGLAMSGAANWIYRNGTWNSFNPEQATTQAPTTTQKPTTTQAPSDGYTTGTVNEWSYAGKWGLYYGDWAGIAKASFKAGSNPPFSVKVNEANKGAQWLVQSSYQTDVTSGHTYRVSVDVTTDKAASIGMKEDLSNGAADPVYTNVNAGSRTTLTGTYTVSQNQIKIMFELGLGVDAGTKIDFNSINIEDITSNNPETTTPQPQNDGPIEVIGQIVSSNAANTINVIWGQNADQIASGQKYNVYVNGVKKLGEVVCGAYDLFDIPKGTYTVKITAVLNGVESAGVEEIVEVNGSVVIETTSKEPETEAPTEPKTEAPTEAPTEPKTEAPTEAPTEAFDLEVKGFQINPGSEGFRTVYNLKGDQSDVVEFGLIYGLGNYATANEMLVNSNNKDVYSYKATEKGRVGDNYVMTMKYTGVNKNFLQAPLLIRVYAKFRDGSYQYSDVISTSVYDIADYLYTERMMITKEYHDYLYNRILHSVNSDYTLIEY